MSSFPYSLEVGGVEKEHQESITIKEHVKQIGSFSAVIKDPYLLDGFEQIAIKRDGTDIFNGRIHISEPLFGMGRTMPISGFDYTARLKQFNTVQQSIVDTALQATLEAILSETDFVVSIDGDFTAPSDLQDWDTSLEFLLDIELFSDVALRYDCSVDVEVNAEFADAKTIQDFGFGSGHNCLFYAGTTQRFYAFTREGGDIIMYHWTTDPTTRTRSNTGYAAGSTVWTVGMHDDKIYLFYEDGGGNTDFRRGAINDADGVVTWTEINNIFAAPIKGDVAFDDSDHVWIVRDDGGLCDGMESEDDGATWNNRFSPPAGNVLWGLAPVGSDGDMKGFVVETATDDLDEYLWDRSAGTFTRVREVRGSVGAPIDWLQVDYNSSYRVWLAWDDGGGGTDAWIGYQEDAGTWVTADIGKTLSVSGNISLCVTEDGEAYIFLGGTGGAYNQRWVEGVLAEEYNNGDWAWNQSGQLIGGNANKGYGTMAVFGVGQDTSDDGWTFLLAPVGFHLADGAASGYLRTESITGGGTFEEWGLVTGTGASTSTILWDTLKAGDNSVLLSDDVITYDLFFEGLPSSEASIKLKPYLDAAGEWIYSFAISERINSFTIDTDFEDCYIGVKKVAETVGADFYVTLSGGVYTLNFVDERGTDRSSYVVLKSSTTSDYPDEAPNLKVLKKVYDWTSYANAVQVLGGLDGTGSRVEVSVKDSVQIALVGEEHWVTVRNGDMITQNMASNLAYVELNARNSVTERINGEFIDKNMSNSIKVGDTVTLICEWEDEDLKVEGGHRMITLTRTWGRGGEKVGADFTNQLKAQDYYNYLNKVQDNQRWIIE
jgi:hypothetical protein